MFDDTQEDNQPTTPAPVNAPYDLGGANQQQTKPNQVLGEEKSDSELEDIFEEVDDDIKGAGGDYINQPPNVNLSADFGQSEEEEEMQNLSGGKNGRIKIIIIIIIIFAIAVGAAWLSYSYFIKSNPDSAVKENSIEINAVNDLPAPADNQNLNENVDANVNAPVEPIKPVDTDGDGLTDDDEIKFGTDPNKIDTDSDGLTDQEEVIKYKTNPHNMDTDGDGYTDGEEVKNGYNPNGEGKLIDKVELPQ
ncbi:MAG: binary toxin-like calcium binding domain-containing protein [bacterium]